MCWLVIHFRNGQRHLAGQFSVSRLTAVPIGPRVNIASELPTTRTPLGMAVKRALRSAVQLNAQDTAEGEAGNRPDWLRR